MRTPPLLLGSTLAFWSWQTGFGWIGLLLGMVLELSRLTNRRWDFSPEEFNQLWNITVLLFLGAVSYAFAATEGASAVTGFFGARSFTERSQALDKASTTVMTFMRWLPFVFFPITLAQAYSNTDKINFKTFSWFLRLKSKKQASLSADNPINGLNTTYPYFAICIVSTSSIKDDRYYFYVGACILIGWALWTIRSKRFSALAWISVFLLATSLGFLGASSFKQFQRIMDTLHAGLLSNIRLKGAEAKEFRTAIGQVGKVKGSGRIVLWVTIPPTNSVMHLLRQSTYNYFRSPGSWNCATGKRDFNPIFPENADFSWSFQTATGKNSVKILGYLDGRKGLLTAPHGLTHMDNLMVFDLKTNSVGTLRVDDGSGLVEYLASYTPNSTFESRPDDAYDLQVPKEEVPALTEISRMLQLSEKSEADRIKTVEQFFAREFSYTLFQDESFATLTNREIQTPLAHFLLKKKAGHCEYFATATALLLRHAGIPSRYVVGFSVQESAGKNKYVVRGRHTHAWCLYYDRTRNLWRELDTTPGTWMRMEEDQKSLLEPIQDAFSWLWLQFSKLRWGQGNLRQYLFYAVVVVVVILVLRFATTKKWRQRNKKRLGISEDLLLPGLDSEFYQIEKRLSEMGLSRREAETWATWLSRIENAIPRHDSTLHTILALHYRLRFDPLGLDHSLRLQLRESVNQWLHRLQENPIKK